MSQCRETSNLLSQFARLGLPSSRSRTKPIHLLVDTRLRSYELLLVLDQIDSIWR